MPPWQCEGWGLASLALGSLAQSIKGNRKVLNTVLFAFWHFHPLFQPAKQVVFLPILMEQCPGMTFRKEPEHSDTIMLGE